MKIYSGGKALNIMGPGGGCPGEFDRKVHQNHRLGGIPMNEKCQNNPRDCPLGPRSENPKEVET